MAERERKPWTATIHTKDGVITHYLDDEPQIENGVLGLDLGENRTLLFSPTYWQKATVSYKE
jgi:hypothetical protein